MLPLRGSGFARSRKGETLKEEQKEYGHRFYMIGTICLRGAGMQAITDGLLLKDCHPSRWGSHFLDYVAKCMNGSQHGWDVLSLVQDLCLVRHEAL
jgi:hypothetical protein